MVRQTKTYSLFSFFLLSAIISIHPPSTSVAHAAGQAVAEQRNVNTELVTVLLNSPVSDQLPAEQRQRRDWTQKELTLAVERLLKQGALGTVLLSTSTVNQAPLLLALPKAQQRAQAFYQGREQMRPALSFPLMQLIINNWNSKDVDAFEQHLTQKPPYPSVLAKMFTNFRRAPRIARELLALPDPKQRAAAYVKFVDTHQFWEIAPLVRVIAENWNDQDFSSFIKSLKDSHVDLKRIRGSEEDGMGPWTVDWLTELEKDRQKYKGKSF